MVWHCKILSISTKICLPLEESAKDASWTRQEWGGAEVVITDIPTTSAHLHTLVFYLPKVWGMIHGTSQKPILPGVSTWGKCLVGFAACQYLESLSQEYTQRTNQDKKHCNSSFLFVINFIFICLLLLSKNKNRLKSFCNCFVFLYQNFMLFCVLLFNTSWIFN